MGHAMSPLAWEVVGLARSARGSREFRGEVLPLLARWIGADGGFAQEIVPRHGSPDEACLYEQDVAYVRRCAANWDAVYAREVSPVIEAANSNGGVAVDTTVFEPTALVRRAVYADICAPQRLRENMFAIVHLDDGASISFSFIRRAGAAPSLAEHGLPAMRSLMPLLALAEGFVARAAQPRAEIEVPIANLTARERELAALVALGYTNREIALALERSVFTVRNQLASIFRKAGVTNRAELAGLLSVSAR